MKFKPKKDRVLSDYSLYEVADKYRSIYFCVYEADNKPTEYYQSLPATRGCTGFYWIPIAKGDFEGWGTAKPYPTFSMLASHGSNYPGSVAELKVKAAIQKAKTEQKEKVYKKEKLKLDNLLKRIEKLSGAA